MFDVDVVAGAKGGAAPALDSSVKQYSAPSLAWSEQPAEIAPRRAPHLTRRALVTMQVKAAPAEALVRLRRHQCWPSRRVVKLLESPIKRMQLLRLVRFSRGLRGASPSECVARASGLLPLLGSFEEDDFVGWARRSVPALSAGRRARESSIVAESASASASTAAASSVREWLRGFRLVEIGDATQSA